jgi:hypothetical protein
MSQERKGETEYAITGQEQIETAKWTRHLPEAFGIRGAVRQSKYRWCFRESAMWGIATGTAMALHRYRMGSPSLVAVNAGYLSMFAVYVGSYYFCVRRRDHQEKMIELMMRMNAFEHASDMPAQTPVNERHPFVVPAATGGGGTAATAGDGAVIPERQYVANLPERKEWQPQLPTRDAASVFQPAGSGKDEKG